MTSRDRPVAASHLVREERPGPGHQLPAREPQPTRPGRAVGGLPLAPDPGQLPVRRACADQVRPDGGDPLGQALHELDVGWVTSSTFAMMRHCATAPASRRVVSRSAPCPCQWVRDGVDQAGSGQASAADRSRRTCRRAPQPAPPPLPGPPGRPCALGIADQPRDGGGGRTRPRLSHRRAPSGSMTRSSARSRVLAPVGPPDRRALEIHVPAQQWMPSESNIREIENQRSETTRSNTPVHCQVELASSQSPAPARRAPPHGAPGHRS